MEILKKTIQLLLTTGMTTICTGCTGMCRYDISDLNAYYVKYGCTDKVLIIDTGITYNIKFGLTQEAHDIGFFDAFVSVFIPEITTKAMTSITMTTATSGGDIITDGGAAITNKGIVWGTNSTPTIADNSTSDGMGTAGFNSSMVSLTLNTGYYVRAYAINSVGIAYGNEIKFKTLATPPVLSTITLDSIDSITQTTAISNSNITSDGNAEVLVRGVVWSISTNPTIADSHTVDGIGTGIFNSSITSLVVHTLYYVRAYASNSVGIAYSNEISFVTLSTAVLPTLITITPIPAYNSAGSGGIISSDGGATVIARGVVWSHISNPTIDDPEDSKTIDGTGIGNYNSLITGLLSSSVYYVRAYATNSVGTAYGNVCIFTTTEKQTPIITTGMEYALLAQTTADVGGHITSDGGEPVITRGVAWTIASSFDPTIADNHTVNASGGIGYYKDTISGLVSNTTYYIRAYAVNSIGIAYGNKINFNTLPPALATITSPIITSITSNSAVVSSNVTNNGESVVFARGIAWSLTTGTATVAGNHISSGTGNGAFTVSIFSLIQYTKYYVRAYATNSVGTAYSNEVIFRTTPTIPTLNTTAPTPVSNSGYNSANSGGNISTDGGSAVIARGVVWVGTLQPINSIAAIDNPYASKTTNGTGTGYYNSLLTGLIANSTYNLRAYATNNVGTAYGILYTHTTTPYQLTTVLTGVPIAYITQTTADIGGDITSDGGQPVITRGAAWTTIPAYNPTITDNHTVNASGGVGYYKDTITGLIAGTTYYVRAYAINAIGINYGNLVNFSTLSPILPTITSPVITSITSSSAIGGSNVTSDGGTVVFARGIAWSLTTGTATVSGTHVSSGMGNGAFTGSIFGLTPYTKYYVRAYATNSIGTAYSNEVLFRTIATVPVLNTILPGLITHNSAGSGGNIVSDGGMVITTRGVVWNNFAGPTTANNKTVNGSGNGSYSSSMTGLMASRIYYVRAYATNSIGTAYGTEYSFLTLAPVIPVITAAELFVYRTRTSTDIAGNISDNGGAAISQHGIVWSLYINPTITDNKTTDGVFTTGTFKDTISPLLPNTTYHARAYAINTVGIEYSNDVVFTTNP